MDPDRLLIWGRGVVDRTKKAVSGVLAVSVPTLDEIAVKERREEERAREAQEREYLEGLCVPRGDVGIGIPGMPEKKLSALSAVEAVTEAMLCQGNNLLADEVQSDPRWDAMKQDHMEVMRALLLLGRIVATEGEVGPRAKRASCDSASLDGLFISRSGFERFAQVLGIEIEDAEPKKLREDLKNNLLDIIGALYQLITTSERPRAIRDIAGTVTKLVQAKKKNKLTRRAIAGHLQDARKRGFDIPVDDDGRAG